ncbi:MAG: hypothetical protein H0V51_00490 [Chloroflexi bacterium]|nr:hypothetical protein [Chloroflexota bacterium]
MLGKRDPRRRLVRLLAGMELRSDFVTLADIERAAARRPARSLPTEEIAQLVEAAVAELVLLADRRTFFDRTSESFADRYVYRVNRRHPLAREELDR